MPSEYRVIQFKPTEVKDAVSRWLRARKVISQMGRVDTIDFLDEDGKISATIHHYELRGRSQRDKAVTLLGHDDIHQIMIIYCKENGIPLALRGKKNLKLLDSRLALYSLM